MRITVATGPLLPVPAIEGGSVPRMWEGLAREFAAAGDTVTVLARAHPAQAPMETLDGVRYRRWGGYAQSGRIGWDLARNLAYSTGLLARLPEGDVLVSNDFWLPALQPWARSRAGALVVSANRWPRGQYRLYTGATAIVAASQAVGSAIAARVPALAPRVHVLPNAVPLATFRGAPSARGAQEPLRILYAGRLVREKGIERMIDALRLLVAGGIPARGTVLGPYQAHQGGAGSGYRDELMARAAGLPIDFIEPEFNPERLAARYCAHHVFCYPSAQDGGEAFGVAPVEAMSCGLVPVLSALPCFRDYLRHEETGLFFDRAGDRAVADLADQLRRLARDDGWRCRLALAAQKEAVRFDMPAVARQFRALFQQVMAGRR